MVFARPLNRDQESQRSNASPLSKSYQRQYLSDEEEKAFRNRPHHPVLYNWTDLLLTKPTQEPVAEKEDESAEGMVSSEEEAIETEDEEVVQETKEEQPTLTDSSDKLEAEGENVSGDSLAQPLQEKVEPAMEADVSGAKVHTDSSAAPLNPFHDPISNKAPGQIIEQLKNTPPTQALTTYAQAQSASVQALETQKQQLQDQIPEIPAPTGLTAKKVTDVGKLAQKAAKEAATAQVPTIGAIQRETSGDLAANYETSVPEIPPSPSPSPTQLAGGEVSQEGQSDPALSQSAQNALDNVPINTNQISTSAGERPNLDLSGEANPSQMETAQAQLGQEVSAVKTRASQAINQDFGENNIFPKPSHEILKTNKELTTIPLSETTIGESPSIPAEAVDGLNQSLSPLLREKIGAEQDKYQAGKEKFDLDSAKANTEANQKIVNLNQETKEKQLAEQKQAQSEVAQYKQEWKSELDLVEKDYQEKAGKATEKQQDKIGKEKVKGEKQASKHLEEAEKKAEAEKQKANKEVAQKKEKAQQESGGFWGWVQSKAKAFIDGIKKAVNFIYDNLRKAIKGIFEVGKKLALAAIDLARQAIVGLIKVYGEIIKGLVKIAFAAFPEIAKKINAKIDQAVNFAVQAVNKAAEGLKTAVTAVLDFLAQTLDSLLGLVQKLYNGIYTLVGMIAGKIKQILEGVKNLGLSMAKAPSQFEIAAYEELLGGNLDEPLPPGELAMAAKAGIKMPNPIAQTVAKSGGDNNLPSAPWTEKNVGVDEVDNNMELAPELSAELIAQTGGDGEVMLGQSNDPSRSMESIMAEATGESQSVSQQEAEKYTDGLEPKQRAEMKWNMLKHRISEWLSKNWPIVGVGTVAAIGLIAAAIFSGGTILPAIGAALPAIMSVLTPVFIGLTIATIGKYLINYFKQGWVGEHQKAGKSLAKAAAAIGIEVASSLTFKVGGILLKGAKKAAKGTKALAKGAVKAARKSTQAVIKGTKFTIKKGKVLFKGIAKTGIGKKVKTLKDLGKRLLEKMRFKAFRIRVKNRRFKLEGLINPWVLLANGEIIDVDKSVTKNGKVGDVLEIKGQKGIIIGKHGASDAPTREISRFVQGLQNSSQKAAETYQKLMEARKTITVGRTKDIISEVGPDGLLEMVDKLGITQVSNLAKKMGGRKLGSVIRGNGADAVSSMLKNYDEIAGLPGAQRLIDDFISGGTTAKGAIGEIKYAAQLHRNGVQIKQLGDVINGRKAADIVLNDGKIIDVKNINWDSSFYRRNGKLREGNVQRTIDDMLEQISRRRREYPGAPIRYAFIGSLDDVPSRLKKALQSANIEIIGVP
ncbi:MAG: hypothetical protein AB4058_20180 [Microcystaceae cyanobacterium]